MIFCFKKKKFSKKKTENGTVMWRSMPGGAAVMIY